VSRHGVDGPYRRRRRTARLEFTSARLPDADSGNGGWVPGFVGPEFLTRWASRTTKDFSEELAKRFSPPSGQLSEETRLNILAYILQANGALPGTEPLTMATDVSLGVVLGNAVRSIGGERDEKR
jgi:hypothetical protein